MPPVGKTGRKDATVPDFTQLLAMARAAHTATPSRETQALVDHFDAALRAEQGAPDKMNFKHFLMQDFRRLLREHEIFTGTICELGGPANSIAAKFPKYNFRHLSLFPVQDNNRVIVGDATQCDHMEDGQFDAIFSLSVFEHIAKPWKAAQHLTRMLKPGGICYHAAPFSYFYHGAPADYWRFTPDAMKLVFSELKPLKAEFYGANRRRDNRGSPGNPVDGDGGAAFAVDALGGWRENWFTIYAGQKDADYLDERVRRAQAQVVVNAMKMLVDLRGLPEPEAAARLRALLLCYVIDQDEDLREVPYGRGLDLSEDDILEAWKTRGRRWRGKPHGAIKISYARFALAARLGI